MRNNTSIKIAVLLSLMGCQSRNPPSQAAIDPTQNTVPAAPADFSAEKNNTYVKLTWQPSAGASSYNVYWSNTAKFEKADAQKLERIIDSKLLHRGLKNGKTYYYRVSAIGPGGESGLSEEVSATPNIIYQRLKKNERIKATLARISNDGNRAVFIADGCGPGTCVYIAEREEGMWQTPYLISPLPLTSPSGGSLVGMSGEGDKVAYTTSESLVIRELIDHVWRYARFIGSPSNVAPTLSRSGNIVLWVSEGKVIKAEKIKGKWQAKELASSDYAYLTPDGEYAFINGTPPQKINLDTFEKTNLEEGQFPVASSNGIYFLSQLDAPKLSVYPSEEPTSLEIPGCCQANELSINTSGDTIAYQGYLLAMVEGQWSEPIQFQEGAVSTSLSADGKQLLYVFKSRVFSSIWDGQKWSKGVEISRWQNNDH